MTTLRLVTARTPRGRRCPGSSRSGGAALVGGEGAGSAGGGEGAGSVGGGAGGSGSGGGSWARAARLTSASAATSWKGRIKSVREADRHRPCQRRSRARWLLRSRPADAKPARRANELPKAHRSKSPRRQRFGLRAAREPWLGHRAIDRRCQAEIPRVERWKGGGGTAATRRVMRSTASNTSARVPSRARRTRPATPASPMSR